MTVYLNQANSLRLEQPREIFNSTSSMCLSVLGLVLATALLGGVPYFDHGSVLWPSFALLLFGLASLGVLKHWKYRRQPILVLSRDGIRLARKGGDRLIPWSNVTENTWHESRYAFVRTSALITLRESGVAKPYSVYAKWLTIGSDEYLRLCDLYAAASRQQHEHG